MRTVSTAFLLMALGTLAACATQQGPRYGEARTDSETGYYENQLTGNRYRVSYNGSYADSIDSVKDMALKRAAELTLMHDYEWFRVTSQETLRDATSSTTSALSPREHVTRDCSALGCTTSFIPAAGFADTYPGLENDRFSTSIEIVMGAGDVEDETTVYDALELYAFLDARY